MRPEGLGGYVISSDVCSLPSQDSVKMPDPVCAAFHDCLHIPSYLQSHWQDGPADDLDDDKEATDNETAEKDAEKGETFSDVSSEPEEDDDQQISNIVVGQFEKVSGSAYM